ncbi:carboxymuconolactone decarboxylase family protein [Shimazuella kribbensis]|uniref:carboxymuconolactone decarboxylase family protein n=1 Tax=Shimazuella kribbensis TaxID=139808 RepID=UPI0003FA39A8|nr:carboxymuconolactone decarboxylase family protein [Shimazuella kribbensis]
MDFKETQKHLTQVPKRIREQYGYYRAFSDEIFSKGVLTAQEKEILAIAVAHVTKCIYCIRFHTKKAKKLGVSIEELLEAVTITGAIEAGNTLYAYQENREKADYFPNHSADRLSYIDPAKKEGVLSKKIRLLTIVAVSHALPSASLQQKSLQQARENGLSDAEIEDAILVTAALKAGGAVSHAAELVSEYND